MGTMSGREWGQDQTRNGGKNANADAKKERKKVDASEQRQKKGGVEEGEEGRKEKMDETKFCE